MADKVTILPRQPLLFKQSDVIGSVRVCPEFTIHDQSFNNCTELDQRLYTPFYKTGDTITFLIKAIPDLAGDVFLYKARLIDETPAPGCGVDETFSPISNFYDESGDFKYYYFSIPTDSSLECCSLKIVITSEIIGGIAIPINEVCSERFSIIADPSCSLYFVWGNDQTNAYGMRWQSEVPLPIVLTARLAAIEWKPKFKVDAEKYIDSKKNLQLLYVESKKIFEVFLDQAPEYVHDFMRIAVISDNLIIDGFRYEAMTEDYTPEWKDTERLAQVKLSMNLYNDKQIKTNC